MTHLEKHVDIQRLFADSYRGVGLSSFETVIRGCHLGVGAIECDDAIGKVSSWARPCLLGETQGLKPEGEEADIVQLGEAVYLRQSRRLFAPSGEERFLRAQSAELLHFLAMHLGELIQRDTLVDLLWPDVAVTDDSLTQCIRDIRKAIGDKNRKILTTIPRRGFVLLGELAPLQDGVPQGASVRQAVAQQSVAVLVQPEPDLKPQLDPRDVLPTLAILPFKSETEGPVGIFGIFLADEIAKLLGMSEDVNVISRMSTGTLAGQAPELGEARRTLNADFVLSGYMVNRGPQVALSLEFAETDSGFALWSERIQVPFDPTKAETEGLELVVANIRRAIMLHEGRRVSSRPIKDLKLFSILHGAIGLMHRLSPKDFQKAKAYLDHLHDIVPNHPAPLAWMARWHVLNSAQGWVEDPEKEASTALQYTARALDLDPYHNLALVCEGQVLTHLARDLDAAEYRYDMALQSNPNDAYARSLRGMLLAFSDRGALGKRDTERAMHLTPMDPHRFMFLALAAGACIANEEFDRALTLTRESLRLNRAHVSSLRMLPVALLGTGDEAAAQKAAAELMELQPDLRVSAWLKSSPSARFNNGKRFAAMLRDLGVPE